MQLFLVCTNISSLMAIIKRRNNKVVGDVFYSEEVFHDSKHINPYKKKESIDFNNILNSNYVSYDMDYTYENNYCNTCNKNQYLTTSHCRFCNVCYEDRDHHCTWFNTCISKDNLRLFQLSLLSCVSSTIPIIHHTLRSLTSFYTLELTLFEIVTTISILILSTGIFVLLGILVSQYAIAFLLGISCRKLVRGEWRWKDTHLNLFRK